MHTGKGGHVRRPACQPEQKAEWQHKHAKHIAQQADKAITTGGSTTQATPRATSRTSRARAGVAVLFFMVGNPLAQGQGLILPPFNGLGLFHPDLCFNHFRFLAGAATGFGVQLAAQGGYFGSCSSIWRRPARISRPARASSASRSASLFFCSAIRRPHGRCVWSTRAGPPACRPTGDHFLLHAVFLPPAGGAGGRVRCCLLR